jgi:hypothetical protein
VNLTLLLKRIDATPVEVESEFPDSDQAVAAGDVCAKTGPEIFRGLILEPAGVYADGATCHA